MNCLGKCLQRRVGETYTAGIRLHPRPLQSRRLEPCRPLQFHRSHPARRYGPAQAHHQDLPDPVPQELCKQPAQTHMLVALTLSVMVLGSAIAEQEVIRVVLETKMIFQWLTYQHMMGHAGYFMRPPLTEASPLIDWRGHLSELLHVEDLGDIHLSRPSRSILSRRLVPQARWRQC
jgi:hypothetical protein